MGATDRYMIQRLEDDGRISYESLSKELGMTGVAIKKRMRKLVEDNLLFIGAQLNTQELGYYLNLILLEVDNESNLNAIKKDFERCPRIISIFTGLGMHNLIALALAEDRHTLESELMGSCSLGTREGVRKYDAIQLKRKLYPPFLPVRNSLATRDKEEAPCGVVYGSCVRYLEEHCLGCPSTRFQRGAL